MKRRYALESRKTCYPQPMTTIHCYAMQLFSSIASYLYCPFLILLSIFPLQGLSVFPKELYDVIPNDEAKGRPAHAIMLRSHKLQEGEVDASVRAIARCGAGTNNIPVARMTELGIPVFNTPGANANAVKELVLCGLLLGSRRVIDGINHMKDLGKQGLARERVEKDKAMFGGREIAGKKLAVIGLGHIGAATARDAHSLGMDLVGYDMVLADSISSAVANADYIR
jgi:D-3-phosphoglycerate dehydrogenase / 2-oxoglutarate reductase